MKRQLSNQELAWCRRNARKIERAYNRYLKAIQILLGSRGIIQLSGQPFHKNSIEDAQVTKNTWEEFYERLNEEEKELVEYIVEGGEYFTKDEKELLVRILQLGIEMGLW